MPSPDLLDRYSRKRQSEDRSSFEYRGKASEVIHQSSAFLSKPLLLYTSLDLLLFDFNLTVCSEPVCENLEGEVLDGRVTWMERKRQCQHRNI